jgi:type I restriction enzyme, S subunit
MRDGWEIKKLGDFSRINYGYTERASSAKIGPKFLRITDIQNNCVDWDSVPYCQCNDNDTLKYKLDDGDIVFARTGATTGKNFLIKNPPLSVFASYLIRLKIPFLDKYNPEFISYFFQTAQYWEHISKGMSGSAQGGFNATKLSDISVPLPSFVEQKRIVSILDEAFSAIAKAKENTEKNLQNAKDLFDSYLHSVFAHPGEDWEEKRFDEVCVLQRGFDLPSHSRNCGSFPLVSSNGITDKIDVYKVKAPGVVTGRSGTIGQVHFIEEDYWPLNTSLYIKEFHGNYEKFIYYFLKQFELKKYTSGAGVPTLNRNNVHGEKVLFPKSILEQKIITQKLDTLFIDTNKIRAICSKKLEHLEIIKASILQKAFSGELASIKELEEVL